QRRDVAAHALSRRHRREQQEQRIGAHLVQPPHLPSRQRRAFLGAQRVAVEHLRRTLAPSARQRLVAIHVAQELVHLVTAHRRRYLLWRARRGNGRAARLV